MSGPQLIGMFLVFIASALAEPVLRARSTVVPSMEECTNTHLPTEAMYLQGLTQYCNNYVKDTVELQDEEELVVTIELRDKRDYPVKWIYKMRWEDSRGIDNGPTIVQHDTCIEYFRAWIEEKTLGGTDTYCSDGDIKLIIGGKYVAYGTSTIKGFQDRPGSKLWIETRQRSDDSWTPTPL